MIESNESSWHDQILVESIWEHSQELNSLVGHLNFFVVTKMEEERDQNPN